MSDRSFRRKHPHLAGLMPSMEEQAEHDAAVIAEIEAADEAADEPVCENCGAPGAMFRGRSKITYCDVACAARCRDLDCMDRTPTHAELAAALARENAP